MRIDTTLGALVAALFTRYMEKYGDEDQAWSAVGATLDRWRLAEAWRGREPVANRSNNRHV
jgi:hypothetical protein